MEHQLALEVKRTELITLQAGNERLIASFKGEATGTNLVKAADTFISGLNTSVPNITDRVDLFKLQEKLEARNIDTSNIASAQAKLFLTPKDVNLNLQDDQLTR